MSWPRDVSGLTGRERRNHAVEVKRAARLLDWELGKSEALADIAIRKRYWVAGAELSTEVWQNYGGVIAPDLSDVAWHAVTIAFLAVDNLEGGKAFYERGAARDKPISDAAAAGVAPILRDLTLGREALAPFASDDRALPQGKALKE
jgi:hypothetical protein